MNKQRLLSGVWSWRDHLSNVARLSLRREFTAIAPLTALWAVLHLQFCSFIGLKALDMTPGQLQCFMFINFLGFFFTGPIMGFLHKVPKMTATAVSLAIASFALISILITPTVGKNAIVIVFLAQIFIAQVCMALVFTLRTAIWRANYPNQHRGKIVVVIELFLSIGTFIVILIYTSLMDRLHLPFQAIYLTSGICGLIAAWLFSRIRLRHEKSQLRKLNNANVAPLKPWSGLTLLRSDKRFAKYMSWQMLNGFTTMIIDMGVLTLILTDLFDSSWTEGGLVLAAVPLLITAIASLVWARFFDSLDIFTIRYYVALTWILSRIFLFIGVWQKNIAIVLFSRAITGVAMGGGRLAWRLGHMEFAPQNQDSLYMSAHVSLTGFRGLIAPAFGIFLYQLELKYFGSYGLAVITLSTLGFIIAAQGFRSMQKNQQKITS
ncbi:MAG: MFS transporter [Planctomycetes bacterium]|nr:MFS transporter [Planctomycetota bacterium]